MMQATRNKALAVSLMVMVAAAVAVLWFRNTSDSAELDKNIFNDFDVQKVDEVMLRSPEGEVNLKFDGSRWMVNNKYAADPSMIEVLFATVLQAVPKRPVSAAQRDSIAQQLQHAGVHVNLHAAGASMVDFRAGGNAAKTQAYFLRSDQDTPYAMVIPGYRVYVSGIFELNESGWRDKRIFAFNWRLNFQHLESVYPSNKADNFRVSLKDQLLTVDGLPAVDSARLNQYLNDVSQLAADEFVVANATLDSLSKTVPAMVLSVRDVGRDYSLKLFRYADSRGRVAGIVNNTQWAMFARQSVVAISRPRRFFEPQP